MWARCCNENEIQYLRAWCSRIGVEVVVVMLVEDNDGVLDVVCYSTWKY